MVFLIESSTIVQLFLKYSLMILHLSISRIYNKSDHVYLGELDGPDKMCHVYHMVFKNKNQHNEIIE